MRAIEISSAGGPGVLRLVERPDPRPDAGEVLVRVAAAGVNRPDSMQRQGKYPPPPGITDIPGLEIAGTIEDPNGSMTWRRGDAVCALVAGGGYASLCAVPEPQCLRMPDGLTPVQAAALPETFFTVWTNLFERGRLQPGESVLVHGGSGGIGTTAIQMAVAFGARAFATAGSAEKCRACVELGAEAALNYRTGDFVEWIMEATRGGGVNVVLDIIGGDYLQRNLDALAMEGRLVQIGLQGGSRAPIKLLAVLQKRLTITGSTLRARSPAEKGCIARALERHVWPVIAAGRIRPVIHATFPLEQAAEAHRVLDASLHIGKIVLSCEP